MVWGQLAPAIDLLHGLDKDALVSGQRAGFVKVEAGEVAQAAFQVEEQAQDAVQDGVTLAPPTKPDSSNWRTNPRQPLKAAVPAPFAWRRRRRRGYWAGAAVAFAWCRGPAATC